MRLVAVQTREARRWTEARVYRTPWPMARSNQAWLAEHAYRGSRSTAPAWIRCEQRSEWGMCLISSRRKMSKCLELQGKLVDIR
jgi:hypothetical protein